MAVQDLDLSKYKLGWSDAEDYVFKPKKGLNEDIIREMSWMKGEPDWMLDFRLKSYRHFEKRPMPKWGGDMSEIYLDDIYYYIKPTSGGSRRPVGRAPRRHQEHLREARHPRGRAQVPRRRHRAVRIRGRLPPEPGGPREAGRDLLRHGHRAAGVPGAGEAVLGQDHPGQRQQVRRAQQLVWSGGSFIYVPPGVNVEMPLQAYFRINAENMGQFERTLIIADEGSQVHYIEGCSAPVYTTDSLHSAVVEIVVKPSARVTYTTIQNWSNNVFNLVTKRARVEAEGHMEWIDGNIGSRLTMKYPAVYMVGPKASGEVLSVAYAGEGQHQDAGAKMVHAAPETTSKIVSKSISKDGGRTSYRGLVRVEDDAYGCKSHVQCDALILDEDSVSDTYPYMEVGARDAVIGHEATVSKVADEQLFYLMSRGLSHEQAMGMIVNGFIEPVTRTLPMEYAVEWSRLIELQMEGSVG